MADRTTGEKKRVVKKKKILAEVCTRSGRSERKHGKFLGRSIITRSKIVSNDGHYSRGGEGKFSRGKNRLDGAFLPPSKGQTRRCSEPTSGNALKLLDGGN